MRYMHEQVYLMKYNTPWHPEDVKAAVRKRGTTLTKLSTDHGYNPDAAGKALKTPWAQLEQIIADFLGVQPNKIWPQRYNAQGIRKTGLSPRGNPRDCE